MVLYMLLLKQSVHIISIYFQRTVEFLVKNYITHDSAKSSTNHRVAASKSRQHFFILYIYKYIYIRGGTVHVFIPNRHGTGISVRCMRPYDEYRQFTPNPEGGARSTATLFDNRQQKNSECQR